MHQLDAQLLLREHCILISPDDTRSPIEIVEQLGLLAVAGDTQQENESEV